MRELLSQKKEDLRRRFSDREIGSESRTQGPKTVESVNGIMQAAARLSTVALVFWVAKSIKGAVKDAQGGFDDIAAAWRNQGKAERDMKETQRQQDEKDTAQIRKDISHDQVERERAKVKFRPKSVRGHWEGNVFIPNEEPAKRLKQHKSTRP